MFKRRKTDQVEDAAYWFKQWTQAEIKIAKLREENTQLRVAAQFYQECVASYDSRIGAQQ